MKNTIKFIGIIAFIAVIGFSMVACDNDNGNGNGGVTLIISGTARVGQSITATLNGINISSQPGEDRFIWMYSDSPLVIGSGEWSNPEPGQLSGPYNSVLTIPPGLVGKYIQVQVFTNAPFDFIRNSNILGPVTE
jgi:hypothetical protein